MWGDCKVRLLIGKEGLCFLLRVRRFGEDVILLHICVSERAVLQDGVVLGMLWGSPVKSRVLPLFPTLEASSFGSCFRILGIVKEWTWYPVSWVELA